MFVICTWSLWPRDMSFLFIVSRWTVKMLRHQRLFSLFLRAAVQLVFTVCYDGDQREYFEDDWDFSNVKFTPGEGGLLFLRLLGKFMLAFRKYDKASVWLDWASQTTFWVSSANWGKQVWLLSLLLPWRVVDVHQIRLFKISYYSLPLKKSEFSASLGEKTNPTP